MRESNATRRLRAGAIIFCLVLVGLPAAAQSPADVWLERLQAERLRAADSALVAARQVFWAPPEQTRVSAPPNTEQQLRSFLVGQAFLPARPRRSALLGRDRLSAQDWRLIEGSFAAEGVPPALLSVGWVESRFDPQALSPKGARGVWQLMPTTARRYGLVVGPERDDRTDLAHSTRAAARHLADLYRQFGDWLLALAAYNAGAPRVEAAMARARSLPAGRQVRNFWQVRAWLPAETRDYVPAVLAAMGSWPAAPDDRNVFSQQPTHPTVKILFASLGPGAAIPPPEETSD